MQEENWQEVIHHLVQLLGSETEIAAIGFDLQRLHSALSSELAVSQSRLGLGGKDNLFYILAPLFKKIQELYRDYQMKPGTYSSFFTRKNDTDPEPPTGGVFSQVMGGMNSLPGDAGISSY